jgi:hypothetical protein
VRCGRGEFDEVLDVSLLNGSACYIGFVVSWLTKVSAWATRENGGASAEIKSRRHSLRM